MLYRYDLEFSEQFTNIIKFLDGFCSNQQNIRVVFLKNYFILFMEPFISNGTITKTSFLKSES